MIEEKNFKIGNYTIVWNRVEALKYISFVTGMFATTFIVGIMLLKAGVSLYPSLLITVSSAMGFLICSLMTSAIINENFIK